jgi:hypothetical protein
VPAALQPPQLDPPLLQEPTLDQLQQGLVLRHCMLQRESAPVCWAAVAAAAR